MARPGAHLQKLVETIEYQTHDRPGVKVKSPAYVPDKTTGELREHDVVVIFAEGHHEIRLALECRDRSRPVGSPEIEAFHTKCVDTGVHSGVLVSSKGFTRPALIKAKRYNIGCMTLSEVDAFDWCQAPGVHSIQRILTGGQILFEFDDAEVRIPPGAVLMEDGTEVDASMRQRIALNFLNSLPLGDYDLQDDGKEFVARGTDGNPRLYLMTPEGKTLTPKKLYVLIGVRISVKFVPFTFHRYKNLETGADITSLATALISFPDQDVQLSIVGPDDGEKSILIGPFAHN